MINESKRQEINDKAQALVDELDCSNIPAIHILYQLTFENIGKVVDENALIWEALRHTSMSGIYGGLKELEDESQEDLKDWFDHLDDTFAEEWKDYCDDQRVHAYLEERNAE